MKRIIFFVALVLLILGLNITVFSQQNELYSGTDFDQNSNVRYRLYITENIWTLLLLDSATGRIWQVNRSTSEYQGFIFAINSERLADSEENEIGRFALYPTKNMWNFILVDQTDGRLWEVQFSVEGVEYIFIKQLNEDSLNEVVLQEDVADIEDTL
ncbi:MAG: hypothetical protein GX770_07475 [Firmicutes bacterium]|nr:hypothetical protein [Bacillota bacterium]